MSPAEVLRAASARIAAGWCRHAEGVDAAARPAHPLSTHAVAWSATGAIYAAVAFDGSPERRALYEAAVTALGAVTGGHSRVWNDAPRRTKDEVVAALDATARGCDTASSLDTGG